MKKSICSFCHSWRYSSISPFIFLIFFFGSLCTHAEESFSFTWTEESSVQFILHASEGEKFSVDWGDGTTPDTYEGIGENIVRPTHAYTHENEYKVTVTTVTDNCKLTHTYLSSYGITSLDITNAPSLTSLYCAYNDIKSLDLSSNTELTMLNCGGNPLTTLDVSKNTKLVRLECFANGLKTFDISKNTTLEILYCQNNELSSLDLSQSINLKELYVNINQLTQIDLSKNTALEKFQCPSNKLTELDITNNPLLHYIYCKENQITRILFAENSALSSINCTENSLSLTELYKLSLQITENANRNWGEQYFAPDTLYTNTPVFLEESTINEINTTFAVKTGKATVPESDYSISDGFITFYKEGDYTVEMMNEAVPYPNALYRPTIFADFHVDLATNPMSIEDADVNFPGDFIYTGNPIEPEPEVKHEKILLVNEQDYELSYTNNVDVGTAQVILTGTGNYQGTKTVDFEIEKASQTITFAEFPIVKLDAGSLELSAAASSGLEVNYESNNEDVAYISQDYVHLLKAGDVEITASQAGNENYHPAAPVTRKLEITDVTGINPITEKRVKIFPNPTNDVVNIESPDSAIQIILYDIHGVVKEYVKNPNVLSLQNYTNGIYYLNVITRTGSNTIKIIKN